MQNIYLYYILYIYFYFFHIQAISTIVHVSLPQLKMLFEVAYHRKMKSNIDNLHYLM